MSSERILITGGAGFIGSHLADALLNLGYRVRVLDSLEPQVHGEGRLRPAYLDPEVELRVGDVRDPVAVHGALRDVDRVVHLAARVGVGQSMYEIEPYVDTNNRGTAVLLQALSRQPVKRLVVASSMSIYGEGLYRAGEVELHDVQRSLEDLRAGTWEPQRALGALTPIPTPERKQPTLASLYALSKYDQERMCLLIGEAYGIPTVALRFFNVYGMRQALSNPYTGVLAIFASRLLNDKPPLIYEDGQQQRDFVHVSDVVQACLAALGSDLAVGRAINVGSGKAYTVSAIARALAEVTGRTAIEPQITGKYRVGDIRHCFADIHAAHELLEYQPQTDLAIGLAELAAWLEGKVAEDHFEHARQQLSTRGLTL